MFTLRRHQRRLQSQSQWTSPWTHRWPEGWKLSRTSWKDPRTDPRTDPRWRWPHHPGRTVHLRVVHRRSEPAVRPPSRPNGPKIPSLENDSPVALPRPLQPKPARSEYAPQTAVQTGIHQHHPRGRPRRKQRNNILEVAQKNTPHAAVQRINRAYLRRGWRLDSQ